MNQTTISHMAAAILWVGLLATTGANSSPPFTHTGECEVDNNGKLNGYCFTVCPPYHTCCSGPSTECPAGRRAKKVDYVPCDLIDQRVDPKKVCQFSGS